MGNLCGKTSGEDTTSQPSRKVGAASSAQSQTLRVAASSKSRGPGRTVGGSSGGTAPDGEDPRAAAARAAEQRASKPQTKGKLGEQLAAQKRQTRNDILDQASRENRGAKDADVTAQVRAYN